MEAVPNAVANWALDVLKTPALIILMMNLIMLVVGMFLDLPAAILLLGPTFIAIGKAIGLDPIQLGIMMAVNLSIGLFSPPVGTTLFVSAAISREPVGAIVRELWPYYAVALSVLAAISTSRNSPCTNGDRAPRLTRRNTTVFFRAGEARARKMTLE